MSTSIDRGAPASGKKDPGLRGSHAVRWWVLVVIGTAQLMVMLDATVVNIALPHAQQDLGFSDGSRQWVITGYALAFGSLLLLGGRLGDLLGRRTLQEGSLRTAGTQPVHEEGEQAVGLGWAIRAVLGGPGDSADHLQYVRVVRIAGDRA